MLGDAETARTALEAARKAKPGAEPILTTLGRAMIQLEESAEAVPILEAAVRANPKSALAHCYLGIARGGAGSKDVAKGVKLGPKDPIVARAAVLYWLEDAKHAKAAKAAARFASLRKDHPMGPFLHWLVLEQQKRYDKAIKAYQKAIKRDDTFLDAHKNLAILCISQNPMYTIQKRTDLAMKHFQRYFELGGKDAGVERVYKQLKAFLRR